MLSDLGGSAERHHVQEGEDPEEELPGQHLVDGGRVVRDVREHLETLTTDSLFSITQI